MLIYDPNDRITASQALKHSYFKEQRESEARYAFSTTQPITYPGQHSDKDEKSSKMLTKTKKKKGKKDIDLDELPPIKKKESKKFGSYGKTMLFNRKTHKHKYVSPYAKKKMSKFSKLEG